MINKVEVIVKEVEGMPRGYMTSFAPTRIDYLNKIMETINSIPGARLVDHVERDDFKPDGTKVVIPLTQTSEIKSYEVDRGILQFKTIIYYEILEQPSRVKKAVKCFAEKIS